MKICFLTQTANDISDFYKDFFAKQNIFFITYKTKNERALSYLPKSTWSEGRNELWHHVKNKFDYYVFMDDDLLFMNFNNSISFSPIFSYLYYKLIKKKFSDCFKQSRPSYFFDKLEQYLREYKPEVAAVTQLDGNPVTMFDAYAMRKNSFVRKLGFFDAQFTILSNYAANKLLPYDTKMSGWSSSQIPIYLYAFHVFGSKAINISELGVTNSYHVGVYAENYNGMVDCEKMINAISEYTGKDYSSLAGNMNDAAVNYLYGSDSIKNTVVRKNSQENYSRNFADSLSGLEALLHDSIVP